MNSTPPSPRHRLCPPLGPALVIALYAIAAAAQDRPPLGTVDLGTATISGALEVADGRAVVRGGGSITARDRTAELRLNRGGIVDVCATSSLHITAGNEVAGPSPLLLALDRGALEVRTATTPRDVVITPDLRFSIAAPGPLNLHLRVTPNGDTCVDNRGLQAPTLDIINQFGDEHYLLRAGQHVLFEHGSLREVVDHESSPCGCPSTPIVSVAAGSPGPAPPPNPASTAARPGSLVLPQSTQLQPAQPEAAAQHPFPAAESQGLVAEQPAAAVPQAPPGQPHAQVAATLAYGADAPTTVSPAASPANLETHPAPPVPGSATGALDTAGSAANRPGASNTGADAPGTPGNGPAPRAAAPGPAGPASGTRVPTTEPTPNTTSTAPTPPTTPPAPTVRAEAPPPPPAPPPSDLIHSIGRFFRRLFGSR